MTTDNSTKLFGAKHSLYALNVAIQALCSKAKESKDQEPGLFYAAAALVEKLADEADKTEARMKAEDTNFYSLS